MIPASPIPIRRITNTMARAFVVLPLGRTLATGPMEILGELRRGLYLMDLISPGFLCMGLDPIGLYSLCLNSLDLNPMGFSYSEGLYSYLFIVSRGLTKHGSSLRRVGTRILRSYKNVGPKFGPSSDGVPIGCVIDCLIDLRLLVYIYNMNRRKK